MASKKTCLRSEAWHRNQEIQLGRLSKWMISFNFLLIGGRYMDRTCDFHRVKVALYRWVNDPDLQALPLWHSSVCIFFANEMNHFHKKFHLSFLYINHRKDKEKSNKSSIVALYYFCPNKPLQHLAIEAWIY